MRLARSLIVTVVVGVCATGCMQQPVNTRDPSRWDLIFRYGELNAYLELRRAKLRRLETELVRLDDVLLSEIGQLRSAQTALQTARAQDRVEAGEAAAIEEELDRLQAEADAAFQNLLAKKIERDRLEQLRIDQDEAAARDAQTIQRLNNDIGGLEEEINGLEAAIQRTINTRARRALRSEPGL